MPAVVSNSLGKGKSYHYYFLPGQSFRYGYVGQGGNASQQTIMAMLDLVTEAAGVKLPVTHNGGLGGGFGVETPLLVGPAGSVVTLLNWAGQEFNSSTGMLTLNISLGFVPSKAQSVEQGVLHPKPVAGGVKGDVTVTLPLASADILSFYKSDDEASNCMR